MAVSGQLRALSNLLVQKEPLVSIELKIVWPQS